MEQKEHSTITFIPKRVKNRCKRKMENRRLNRRKKGYAHA